MTNRLNQSTRLPRLTKTKGIILASLIAGAMVVPFIIPAQKAHAANDDSDQGNSEPLLGTWLLQVTLDPNTVPPATTLVFTVVPTFGAGGGIVGGETGNGPGGVGGAPE